MDWKILVCGEKDLHPLRTCSELIKCNYDKIQTEKLKDNF